jgi:hypothetical protein
MTPPLGGVLAGLDGVVAVVVPQVQAQGGVEPPALVWGGVEEQAGQSSKAFDHSSDLRLAYRLDRVVQ